LKNTSFVPSQALHGQKALRFGAKSWLNLGTETAVRPPVDTRTAFFNRLGRSCDGMDASNGETYEVAVGVAHVAMGSKG
jgi:hypothetical protein